MKYLLQCAVAMLMGGVALGYVLIAYSLQWDWVLAASRMIQVVLGLIS